MSELIHIDDDYRFWVKTIRERYLNGRHSAVLKANQELLHFYWQPGKDIAEMHVEEKWGKKVLRNLSQDLKHDLPDVAVLSETSHGYMKRLYLPYSQIDSIHPQAVGEFFPIPWGDHRFIIDKCYNDPSKALFLAHKTCENNWSRDVFH